MDGRVQIPVISFLMKRFQVDYVDIVSEPAPSLILAQRTDKEAIASIFRRIDISVSRHHSEGIAVVGHHDCAGTQASESEQLSHLREAALFLKVSWTELEVIGLWVDNEWMAREISLGEEEIARTKPRRHGSLQWGYTLAPGAGWGYSATTHGKHAEHDRPEHKA